MKALSAILFVFVTQPTFASGPAVEVLNCSNYHQINDPGFQQGDELFAKVLWNRSSEDLEVILNQMASTRTYRLQPASFQKPSYSWLSGKDLDSGVLFRFTYLGGTHWGGYFDSENQTGQELMCTETKAFQELIDFHKLQTQ